MGKHSAIETNISGRWGGNNLRYICLDVTVRGSSQLPLQRSLVIWLATPLYRRRNCRMKVPSRFEVSLNMCIHAVVSINMLKNMRREIPYLQYAEERIAHPSCTVSCWRIFTLHWWKFGSRSQRILLGFRISALNKRTYGFDRESMEKIK